MITLTAIITAAVLISWATAAATSKAIVRYVTDGRPFATGSAPARAKPVPPPVGVHVETALSSYDPDRHIR